MYVKILTIKLKTTTEIKMSIGARNVSKFQQYGLYVMYIKNIAYIRVKVSKTNVNYSYSVTRKNTHLPVNH